MTFPKTAKTMVGVLGVAASAIFGSQALAQEKSAEPQQAAPSTATPAPAKADIPEAKLKSFAVAYLEVDKITKSYLPKLKEAKSPEDQQKVRQEAGQKMMQAVQGSGGISVDEYNQIAQTAQTDPDVANKLTRYIRDADKQ